MNIFKKLNIPKKLAVTKIFLMSLINSLKHETSIFNLLTNEKPKIGNTNAHSELNLNLKRSDVMQNQQGATLIVVLIMLVLVSSIAAVAIRSGNSDLKVATADQVDKILFQSNDASFLKVEKEDRVKSQQTSLSDLKGFITSDQVKASETVAFCVREQTDKLFSLDHISLLNTDRNAYTGYKKGICDLANPNDYISAKGRILSQMTFIKGDITKSKREKFVDNARGSDSNDTSLSGGDGSNPTCLKFTGYVTTVLPSMSGASATHAQIAECLDNSFTVHAGLQEDGSTVSALNGTVSECLDVIGASYDTHMQVYRNIPAGYSCL